MRNKHIANWVRDHVQWEVLETFAISHRLGIRWDEIDRVRYDFWRTVTEMFVEAFNLRQDPDGQAARQRSLPAGQRKGARLAGSRSCFPVGRSSLQALILEFEGLRAAVVNVRLNGHGCGSIAWAPHCLDITQGACAGKNLLEVELVGTLRNLLGPLHLAGGDPEYTGPGEYREKRLWTEDTILAPFGFDGVQIRILEN